MSEAEKEKGLLQFLRNLYGILSVQLLVSLVAVMVTMSYPSVRTYVQQTPALFYSALILTTVIWIGFTCFHGWSALVSNRTSGIMLGIFTLCQSYLLATSASYYDSTIVLQTVNMTTLIATCLTVYAALTTSDVTRWRLFLFCLLLVFWFGLGCRLLFPTVPLMDTIWAAFATFLFSAYLIFDTFFIIHTYPTTEYWTAALMLYLDIVNIFLNALRLSVAFRGKQILKKEDRTIVV